jgi:hypothetical protein
MLSGSQKTRCHLYAKEKKKARFRGIEPKPSYSLYLELKTPCLKTGTARLIA